MALRSSLEATLRDPFQFWAFLLVLSESHILLGHALGPFSLPPSMGPSLIFLSWSGRQGIRFWLAIFLGLAGVERAERSRGLTPQFVFSASLGNLPIGVSWQVLIGALHSLIRDSPWCVMPPSPAAFSFFKVLGKESVEAFSSVLMVTTGFSTPH